MGEFPTQKQEDYARKIANTLGISLPEMKTKESYSQFISQNPCADQLKLSVTDVPLCFVEKESTRSIIKRNLKVKTLLKEYEPSIIREAYWRLYGDKEDET